ncbi:DUF2007 domain-containing protein [Tenacibaculum maritimum]|uniref:DUF2007 domain-containing protein n=1 Tax=Tenacibaculum maritimum NCIMB 2154 TaxID=1349785 RepID=A0A2H1EBR3_9FLAO|nr:DUF2007 domain-containing protein [Tenacibaculum maritimum]MCD9585182.1 DUF2007 domain-containing protein [Tenacibaculum maritimum]MCD9611958.1 DUF2007 domain-containing protein [Tenacibaculum maritimum]MCD9621012.1 DUF2007 domain-containing protein [Tenacibaculum maritimum]MCD9627080.1 DUF2007 domain-containing protein [Tenacibaculum maritimum]MCD9631017.1 DUF2007 domain-containing protein [Tenacibaculum maritimum]
MLQNHVRIFTGSAILVNRLKFLLDEINITSIINNGIEAGRLAGFGTLAESVDLYILKKDVALASSTIEKFQKEITN